MSVSKWLVKYALVFFLLFGIFGILTLNDAKIDASTYQIQTNSPSVINSFTVDTAKTYQFYMFITNNQTNGYVHFILEKKLDGGGIDIIFETNNQGMFKNIFLHSGSYQVVAEFVNQGSTQPAYQTEIMFGKSENVNITLAGLAILFFVIFAVLIGIFCAVIPFAIAAMIIHALVSNSKSRSSREPMRYEARSTRTMDRSETRSTSPPVSQQASSESQVVEPAAYLTTLSLFDPESYISKFTKREWVLSFVMALFLLIFVTAFEPVSLFFALLVLAMIVYSVNEREKTVHRILILLSRNKETSIGYIATQTDKKITSIKSILQRMILDEGYPLTMDSGTGLVKVLGDLSPYMQPNVFRPSPSQAIQEDVAQVETSEPEPEVAPVEEVVDEGPYTYCQNCGEKLPEFTKYCFICGSKQT